MLMQHQDATDHHGQPMPPSFLGLPTELRIQVYDHIYPRYNHDDAEHCIVTDGYGQRIRCRHVFGSYCKANNSLAITRVNQLIRGEAIETLYKTREIRICCTEVPNLFQSQKASFAVHLAIELTPSLGHLLRWNKLTLNSSQLPALRHLHLLDLAKHRDWAKDDTTLVKASTSFMEYPFACGLVGIKRSATIRLTNKFCDDVQEQVAQLNPQQRTRILQHQSTLQEAQQHNDALMQFLQSIDDAQWEDYIDGWP